MMVFSASEFTQALNPLLSIAGHHIELLVAVKHDKRPGKRETKLLKIR